MRDQSRTVAAVAVGAALGAVAGDPFFTDEGRRVRRRIEPMLEDAARELRAMQESVRKASGVAGDGWRMLTETFVDGDDDVDHRVVARDRNRPF